MAPKPMIDGGTGTGKLPAAFGVLIVSEAGAEESVRRFRRGEGKARRIWQVNQDGCWLETWTGKPVGEPKTTRKLLKSADLAIEDEFRAIRRHLDAGWVEIEPEAPVAEAVGIEPHVKWDGKSRARVLPWKRRPRARHADPSAYRNVQRIFKKDGRKFSKGLDRAKPPMRALTSRVLDVFRGPEPESFDLVTQAVAGAMADNGALVDWWCGRFGVHMATRAMTIPPTMETTKTDYHGWFLVAKPNGDRTVTSRLHSPWHALRRQVAKAGDDEFEKAVAFAAEAREVGGPGLRAAICFAFPMMETWSADDADRAIATGVGDLDLPLFTAIADIERAIAFTDRVMSRFNRTRLLTWLDTTLDRFGIDALPIALKLYETAKVPAATLPNLRRIVHPDVAEFLAARFSEDAYRAHAETYLQAYPEYGIPALEAVVGRKRSGPAHALLGKLRLRYQPVVAAPTSMAEADVPADLLAVGDGGRSLPVWFRPTELPRPTLRDGRVLPLPVLSGFARIFLDISGPEKAPEAVEIMREHCEPESLATFAWAVMEAWLEVDGWDPYWPVFTLAHVGTDNTARDLSKAIQRWPREKANKRAVAGVDTLARMSSDVAMLHLNAIHSKVRYKLIRERAGVYVMQLARRLNISEAELQDRLIPRLGLDDRGTLLLDYGPRQFTVGFDERLNPFVLDSEGGPLKSAPRARKSDDPEKAKAATETWKGLRKDVKTIASAQIKRMEMAMIERRSWPRKGFEAAVVGHPILLQLARGVVWSDGSLQFRVAEDGTYSDIDDETVSLTVHANLFVLHPIEMTDDEKRGWGEVFADYEILQAFEQLDRAVYPPAKDANSASIERLTGGELSVGRILGLANRGWRRNLGEWVGSLTRDLLGTRVTVSFSPTFNMGAINPDMEVHITGVQLFDKTWDAVSGIVYSETVRDLIKVDP